MTLSALAGCWSQRCLRHRLAACQLHRVRPRRIARLAGDRSRVSGLPAVVARVLGAMVSAALAGSSVAPAVLRLALIGRRSLLRLGLVSASYDDAVVGSCATCLSIRLHRLLLKIGSIQEFPEPGLLLS
jgi:hypothetical protein